MTEFRLCSSDLWNAESSWHTDKPRLSACFRDTVLVWLPAVTLLSASLIEYISIRRSRLKGIKQIPWNLYNSCRIFLTVLLLLNAISEAFSISKYTDGEDNNQVIVSAVIAPVVRAVCYLSLISTYYVHRKVGRFTSGPIWFYLFISEVCESIEFFVVITDADYNVVELIAKSTHFLIITVLFLLECRGDTPDIQPNANEAQPDSPEIQASFFSRMTFSWYGKFLLFGYRNELSVKNIWKIPVTARILVQSLLKSWLEKGKCKKGKTYQLSNGNIQGKNNILKVFFNLYWTKLILAGLIRLAQDSFQFLSPIILKSLLAFMKSDEPLWHGILLALMLLVVSTIKSILQNNGFHLVLTIGIQTKTMVAGAIYRKALLLSGSSRLESTSGEIVNLMAVDSRQIQDIALDINWLWSAPIQITFAIVLLYQELGWSIFAGVLFMVLVLPFNAYMANRMQTHQIKLMKIKDQRIKQMNEILSGIKVIKLYAWENSFMSSIFNYRNNELNYLKNIFTLDVMQTFLWRCSPFVVALVSFAVYVSVDEANVLNEEKAFVSIALFNLLKVPLGLIPEILTSLVQTMVSVRRINKFLNRDENVKYVTRNEELDAVAIEGGTLCWSHCEDKDEDQDDKLKLKSYVLKDINFHVKPGSFVAIIGQVGSGKSSLISSILGEMYRISGRFNVSKSMNIAYVPQQAWIQNMTVKDNILFGSPFSADRYEQVLSVCALESDLETLPGGDEVEIGEKGINLSGGQKQRVSLARACYSNSDIFLLDDPLSALDNHVAKHVFEKVLSSSTGLLRDKTRILATNNLYVLPFVDQVVVLDRGRIVESGTFSELIEIDKGYLNECMRQYSKTQIESPTEPSAIVNQSSFEQTHLTSKDKSQKVSTTKQKAGKLTEDEKLETGSVNYTVYLNYFKSLPLIWMLIVAASSVGSAVFNVATNLWLAVWSSDSADPQMSDDSNIRTMRLITYGGLGCLRCAFILSGYFCLTRASVQGSKVIHNNLLQSIMRSPMNFFDITPMGRVINRFAKDIDVVDRNILSTLENFISYLLLVLSTIFVISYSFPSFLYLFVPLGVTYYITLRFFIVTIRQLRRLESISTSPVYSHFNETLSGTSTIRAYNCVDRFVTQSDDLLDRNQSCRYSNICANRWLSMRFEFFGTLITTCVALFSVYNQDSISAAIAGLTISFSLSTTSILEWVVRTASDLETDLVSVERILEYTQNEQEDSWIKETRPEPDWPNKGAIQIQNYSSKYREDTGLVLKDLSVDIKPCEKIGIVGRTGSGKSSLSLSLFRILESTSGTINIDNMDIAKYGLHDLRLKLTIIPQDPVLFSGTLRFNLDPLEIHDDEEIWKALDQAHLKSYVTTLKLGLDYEVSEFGENFSVGQRQLICLARAILRKSKILILDEATASVDLETDTIVQKTIRETFSDCTILTIAHRLHTILDSDRILVLHDGKVTELDTPENLLQNESSAFYSLARDAGIDAKSIVKLNDNSNLQ